MAEERSSDSEQTVESWLNSFEEECLEEWDREPKMEDLIQAEREYASQKLWLGFQNSATSIAQLYKDRYQGLSLWLPFQNAASSVTVLYKDSIDSLTNSREQGYLHGKQTRTRDIIAWAKKKRRHIRREELIAFLCGKTLPPRNRLAGAVGRPSRPNSRVCDRISPRLSVADGFLHEHSDTDLQPFRDALVLQGLNGAMSNINMGYRPSSQSATSPAPPVSRSNSDELNCFILDELSRHCDGRKRAAPSDVIADSPSRKRNRFL